MPLRLCTRQSLDFIFRDGHLVGVARGAGCLKNNGIMGVVKLKQVTEYNAHIIVFPNKYNHVAHFIVSSIPFSPLLYIRSFTSCHDDNKTFTPF